MARSGTNGSGKGQFGRIRPENGISGPARAIQTGSGAKTGRTRPKPDDDGDAYRDTAPAGPLVTLAVCFSLLTAFNCALAIVGDMGAHRLSPV